MNKIIFSSILTAGALVLGVAACSHNGGFSGPARNTVSVQEVKGLNDDTYVVMQWSIKQKLNNGMYVFTDGINSINVVIDEATWKGQKITADNIVIIKGQLNKSGQVVEVEVEDITLLK